MPQSDKAWVIPPVLTPLKRRCVVLYIPDERLHIASFWGALLPLTQWLSWERDENRSGKILASYWKEIVYDAWDRFGRGECCPTLEVLPPPPPARQVSGVIEGSVGQLGLSITELENLLMATIMGIRWNEGVLEVQYFPCCDWVPVEGLVGEVQQTGGEDEGSLTLADLIDNVQAVIKRLGYPVPPPPSHTTVDSVRCSKATAMQDGWFLVMNDLEAVLDVIDITNVTVGIIAEVAVGALLTGGWALLAIVTVAITTYINEANLEDVIAEMSAQYNDTTMRENIICTLTTKLSEGTEITSDDLRAFITAWQEVSNPSGTLKNLMKSLPGGWMRDQMQVYVPETPCACDQYKPYGTPPPSTSGAINFSRMVGVGGTITIPQAPGGLPFDQIDQWNPLGTKTGVTAFRSQYRGVSGTTYYSGVGVLLECPADVIINQIAAVGDVSNSQGAGQVKLFVRMYNSVTGWLATGASSGVWNDTNDGERRITGLSDAAEWIYVFLEVSAVNSPQIKIEIPNILFTGQVGGVGFLDKGIGQVLA